MSTTRPRARVARRPSIEAAALGPHAWRICDRSVPADDAATLLAYAERGPGWVDVVWMRRRDLPSRFASIDEVLGVALRTAF